MTINNDYYGDGLKWFVGVVKDTSDPNNRVRVRIKGIHPEDPDGDGTHTPASGGGGSSGSSGGSPESSPPNAGGSSGSATSDATATATLPAYDPLPKSPHASSAPISKHFKLGHLTAWAPMSAPYIQPFLGQITQDQIKNMSLVAVNILDPLKENFPSIQVTSGWRPVSHDPSGNHRTGFAADVQIFSAPGKGCDQIFEFIKNNLKGRYSFVFHEHNHIHVMFEGGGGSRGNPKIRVK